ncbi:hypothetical protein B0H21DRAFT_755026 [Amylocystis lapponica]|nr:hypothetical protein B0H21DRAFT_755026 [Amylocystis lapponica]
MQALRTANSSHSKACVLKPCRVVSDSCAMRHWLCSLSPLPLNASLAGATCFSQLTPPPPPLRLHFHFHTRSSPMSYGNPTEIYTGIFLKFKKILRADMSDAERMEIAHASFSLDELRLLNTLSEEELLFFARWEHIAPAVDALEAEWNAFLATLPPSYLASLPATHGTDFFEPLEDMQEMPEFVLALDKLTAPRDAPLTIAHGPSRRLVSAPVRPKPHRKASSHRSGSKRPRTTAPLLSTSSKSIQQSKRRRSTHTPEVPHLHRDIAVSRYSRGASPAPGGGLRMPGAHQERAAKGTLVSVLPAGVPLPVLAVAE